MPVEVATALRVTIDSDANYKTSGPPSVCSTMTVIFVCSTVVSISVCSTFRVLSVCSTITSFQYAVRLRHPCM